MQGYLDRNIPVGAVDIDSTWATQFNNFEVDTAKFNDFPSLITSMHDINVRVILWATSMVNVENPDYDMAVQNQYLVRNGKGVVRPLHWWHGDGGLLDYTNPAAVQWWHEQMDRVLDAGVDGFKCDGTDPYIIEYQLLTGALGYNDQELTYRQYADMYYGDFFNYTRAKRGNTGLIMSRPVDCFDSEDAGCMPFSPHDVMWSGWVGDDDASFQGLRSCARKVLYSAQANYTNFGCDIGGYRGIQTSQKELFIRWAQLGAFLPLMENGGGGEHRPWMYDEQTVDIYRHYVLEHYKLLPYLLTQGNQAREAGVSTITPLTEADQEHPLHHPQPTTFSYLLGKDLLVHPAITDINDREAREEAQAAGVDVDPSFSHVAMTFPGDSSTQWLDYFHPHDADRVQVGDSKVHRAVALADYAVYVRRGALMPLQPTSSTVARKDVNYIDAPVAFTWYAPVLPTGDEKVQISTEVREYEGAGIVGSAALASDGTLTATISAHETFKGGFDIIGITEPASVLVEKTLRDLEPCVHRYADHTQTLSVHCPDLSGGVKITATGVKNSF